MADKIKNTRSNATKRNNHLANTKVMLLERIAPVASEAAIITGTTIGKKRIGSVNSFALVFTAIAEKVVPTAQNPRVPSRQTAHNLGSNNGRLKRIQNVGNRKISTEIMKEKMLRSLPK